LKTDPSTRHIPVHFMSAEEPRLDSFAKGAIGYLTKPVSQEKMESTLMKIENMILKKMKELLVVENNDSQRKVMVDLVGGRDIVVSEKKTGGEAISAAESKQYDCMIIDLELPDMTGFELLETMKNSPDSNLPPVIVYSGRELSSKEERTLRKYSDSIIIKGVKSDERLLDETSLFLHRMVKTMPRDQQKIISDIHNRDQMFENKTILIVDDDMRNMFALSKLLKDRQMTVLKAENGKKALDLLNKNTGIDLVLMDIMMPVMDGYEAIRQIRKDKHYKKVPIIALTAKAMKQDKADCIQAGANDYLVKPVDVSRLLSMMRVWLYE